MRMFDSDIRNADTQVELRKKEARENLKADKGEEVSPDEMEEVGPAHQESTFRFDQNYKTTPEPSSKGYVDTKKPLEYRNDALQQTDGIGNVVKKNLPEGTTLEDLGKNPTTGEEIPYYAPSGRPWTDVEKEAIKLTGNTGYIEGITEADLGDIEGYRSKKQKDGYKFLSDVQSMATRFGSVIMGAGAVIADIATAPSYAPNLPGLAGSAGMPAMMDAAEKIPATNPDGTPRVFDITHGTFGSMATDLTKRIDEDATPHYASKEVQDMNFGEKIMNPAKGGWGLARRAIMDGVGTSVGAYMTGTAMNAALEPYFASGMIETAASNMVKAGVAADEASAMTLISQQKTEAFKYVVQSIANKAKTSALKNVLMDIPASALGATGESLMQAQEAEDQWEAHMKDIGYTTNPEEYEKYKSKGLKYIEQSEWDRRKADVGNVNFMLNLPLLTVGNSIQFGKYLTGVNKAGSSITSRMITTTLKTIAKSPAATIARAVGGHAYQGFEEMQQSSFVKGAINYEDAIMDNPSNAGAWELTKSMGDGMIQQYGSAKNWDEFYVGVLSSAVGMPIGGGVKNAKYNKEGSWWNRNVAGRDYVVGGLKTDIKEAVSDYKEGKQRDTNMKNITKSEPYSRWYTQTVANMAFQKQKDAAEENGDVRGYEEAENAQFVNDALTFHNAGKLDDFLANLDKAQLMSADDLLSTLDFEKSELASLDKNEFKRSIDAGIEEKKRFAKEVARVNDFVKKSNPHISELASNSIASTIARSEFIDKKITDISNEIKSKVQLGYDVVGKLGEKKEAKGIDDYFGLKDRTTIADKFSKDVSEHVKENPQDLDLIEKANILVDYIDARRDVVKKISEMDGVDIDARFEKTYNEKIKYLQKIETERNKVDHHEEIRKDIEAKPEVIDLDEEGNPTQEKIERPEVTLDENEVIEESELPSEPASKRVANKTEAKSVLGKIQSAFNKVKLKGDQRLVRHGEKIEAYDRVTNAIKDESKEEIEFKAKKKELNDAETDRLVNEAIDNGATEEDVAKIASDRKEALSKEIETPSTKAGNIVDTFLRNYLLGTNDESLRSKFSPEAYGKIIEVAKKIKQEYSGWTLYPVDMFVHETEAKIGGVTDLIAMNSKGQIKVIDFKTRNTKEYKEGKKHQKQLSAYAIALNNTHGLDVIGTQIVDIPVDYDTEIENIATLTVDGIDKISFIDHDILQSVAGMKMKSFQDTTKGKDNGDDKNAFDQSSAYKNTVKYNPAERNRDLSNQFNFKTGETVTFKISPNNKENSAEKAWIDILLDGKFVGWLQFEGVDEIRKKVFAGENVKATITATQEQGFNLGQISTVSKLPGLKVGSSPKKSTKSIVSNAKGVIIGGLDKETGENTFMEQGYAYVLIPDNIDNPVFYTVKRAMNYQLKDIGTEQSKQVIDFLAETAKVVSGVSKENPFMTVGKSLFDMVQAVSNITWESKANKAERSLALKQYENESIKKSKGPVKFDALFIIRDGSANVVRIVSSNGIFMITGGQVYEKIKSGNDFDYVPSNRDASELINEAAQLVRPQIGFGNTKVPRLVVAETKKDMDGNIVEVKGIKNDIDKWEFAETFITTDVRPAVEGGGFYAAPRFNFEIKSETKPAEVAVKKVNEVSVSRAKSIIERMKKLDMIKETGC